MKVVLFCGGFGMRIRDYSQNTPKPMVPIGYRPILWHVMKYYAHFGHKEFILCLGYGADVIKGYFLSYNECLSNDFVLSGGGKNLELINTDIQDWKITFADTGIGSSIGQRLKAVEKYLGDDEQFFATYSDGLTDLPLSEHIEHFQKHDLIGSFLCVRPRLTYHSVKLEDGDHVAEVQDLNVTGLRINGGYFVFKRKVFDYIRNGEDLVNEPFQRLIKERQLLGYRYDGFWGCMDTFKDKQYLDELDSRGSAPWEVWKKYPRPEREAVSVGR
jgi:glucose-1-phosphate cytidylyltransferase